MEKINEKLENIEEIMDLLIGQMKSHDEKLSVIIEQQHSQADDKTTITTPDGELMPSIEELNKFAVSMNELKEKIEHLPKAFKLKHQYEINSKFYFTGAIIIFLVVAISLGSSISLIFRNGELETESDKFKVIRGAYPELAIEIDGHYLKDKENLIKNADLQIHQHKVLVEASLKEAQAKKDYESARQAKKSLKDKQKKAN
ncbi:hypothetical protein EZ449_04865 [Pedobacter frigidisoli]|uniref:Uncharacterized protein n=1 Tax=Pedobacter frigidisoli TaxID=2530455 RepID=A0A4R0P406_9SPHI|nr:hypothetical protein [Pedobacter frigidisoli]TCD11595.1 hypothetical protein EZ449_04865 [Pedobacter frigidisoli]